MHQKECFKKWMKNAVSQNGTFFSNHSINQYCSYIATMPNFIVKNMGLEVEDLFLLSTLSAAESFFNVYIKDIKPNLNDPIKTRNFHSAFSLYMRFLAENESEENYMEDEHVPATEKLALVRARKNL